MVYNDNIPQPQDPLSVSQGDILENFKQLNIIYGTDHIAYDSPVDVGKHKTVTYVTQETEPNTVANEVKSFSFVPSTDLGEIEFSKGPNDPVPTPLTSLHSVPAGIDIPTNSTVDILNFSNFSFAIAELYAFKVDGEYRVSTLIYDGTSIKLTTGQGVGSLGWQKTANILQLKNTGTNVKIHWSVKFIRVT